MRASTASALLSALATVQLGEAAPRAPVKRDVDTRFPYTGPDVPVGDWVDPTVNGNGKGFPRLVEAPAVKPSSSKPKNNINVISVAYIPNGVTIHYQTPFGLAEQPCVHWGSSATTLDKKAAGETTTYDRTPPCSEVAVTQCSQFYHNVQIENLKPGQTYYYSIPAANGTTASQTLSFKTAHEAGNQKPFSIAVLNDMGYTNARGTHKHLAQEASEGLAFAWHGGDISYADDWYSGILPCVEDWPVCYNGSDTRLPGGPPYPPEYLNHPIPKGEEANQGGPWGGDMSVLYESNWDLWQQWMNKITMKIPYMVLPGNHEAACAEFDGGNNTLTAYLNDDKANSSAPESALTYYSCPPSQRNFTTYQHRFRMPGAESGGVGNFWYSFDYGLAHFVAIDGETDFPFSPEYPFVRDTDGKGLPAANETYSTDSGPFGAITGNWTDNESYEQWNWLKNDLANVDKTKTPWIIAMSHRPMYSSEVSSYQEDLRNAFEDLLIDAGVDMYLAGHIHWYERLWPLTKDGKVDKASVVDKDTYTTNPGVSLTHIINGMAGNIESHSTLGSDEKELKITNVLDQEHYGFSKLTFHSAKKLTWQFIRGVDGAVGDELTLVKKSS